MVYKFDPQVLLGALWNNEAAELGNHIHPIKVHSRPDVQLLRATSHNATGNSTLDRTQLTVIMTDPDAPSRWNPMWSEMCHWIVTNLTLTTVSTSPDSPTFKNSTIHRTPKEIVPYLSPAPPSFTGPHRYVLLVLAPKNRTSEALNLTTPTDRMHWGYKTGYARRGARRWANENGLEVIGTCQRFAQPCMSELVLTTTQEQTISSPQIGPSSHRLHHPWWTCEVEHRLLSKR